MHIAGTMNLMNLPRETLEEIATNLDSHHDLISLALVSSTWKSVIIPRHSQYRIIRIRGEKPGLWAHLARRADLARTIKAIHLYHDLDATSPEIYPTTLLEEDPTEQIKKSRLRAEEYKVGNMCQALGHMTSLKEFVWSTGSAAHPTYRQPQEAAIFSALSRCQSLTHLTLLGRFAERAALDCSTIFPLWKISNLETLTVKGGAWVNRLNTASVVAMLKLSPQLQALTFPMESPALPDCHFPRLRKLVLALQSGTTSRIDASRIRFIEAHPTIEELYWYPVGTVKLEPGILPAAKRLSTRADLVRFFLLERLSPPRPLEYLCGIFVDTEAIEELDGVVVDTLRTLRIARYDNLPSIGKLAKVFPALTSLEAPSYATLSDGFNIRCFPADDWIPALSQFKNLEVFGGGGLWAMKKSASTCEMDRLITKVALACPKLREIEHWELDSARACHTSVVIKREGTSILWNVRVPPARFAFDSIISKFD